MSLNDLMEKLRASDNHHKLIEECLLAEGFKAHYTIVQDENDREWPVIFVLAAGQLWNIEVDDDILKVFYYNEDFEENSGIKLPDAAWPGYKKTFDDPTTPFPRNRSQKFAAFDLRDPECWNKIRVHIGA